MPQLFIFVCVALPRTCGVAPAHRQVEISHLRACARVPLRVLRDFLHAKIGILNFDNAILRFPVRCRRLCTHVRHIVDACSDGGVFKTFMEKRSWN